MSENEIIELENFYKNNRSKKHTFPYISQREEWDCGVACMAMVSEKPYWEVRGKFQERPNRGISLKTIFNFINRNSPKFQATSLVRFTGNLKSIIAFEHRISNNKYTCALLLSKSSLKDWGHYVLMDNNHNIYDPEDGILKVREYIKYRPYFSAYIKLEARQISFSDIFLK